MTYFIYIRKKKFVGFQIILYSLSGSIDQQIYLQKLSHSLIEIL